MTSQTFWENYFKKIHTAWGFKPSVSAQLCSRRFNKSHFKKILLPGCGYGRNAKPFLDKKMKVDGIEISSTAAKTAKALKWKGFKIITGSVLDMPFNNSTYDGIFCYAVLHLFSKTEGYRFIRNCYRQLNPGGEMVFVVVTTKSSIYKIGRKIRTHRYEIQPGLKVQFYNHQIAKLLFKNFSKVTITEIDEPIRHMRNQMPLNCLMISCTKPLS